jgi:hypothetical protein
MSARRTGRGVLACAALLGLACGSGRPGAAPTVNAPARPAVASVAFAERSVSTPEIVVTRPAPDTRGFCRPRGAALSVVRFLDAVNRGDPAAADAFDFDAEGGWFSDAVGTTAASAYSADELGRYFASRHAQREQLRLVELRIDPDGQLGQLEFALTRRADDLPRRRWIPVEGKGAITCAKGRPAVWSMGTVSSGEKVGRLCPRPPPQSGSRQRVVVCAR